MKSKYLPHPITLFISLSIFTIMLSWIGSIYKWQGVQNLLSSENLRWILTHANTDFFGQKFVTHSFFLAMGIGTVLHSGLYATIARRWTGKTRLTHKERRALWTVLIGSIFYFGILSALLFLSKDLLYNIWGGLENSPFAYSAVFLLAQGIALSSILFGFTMDRYRSGKDVFAGISFGIQQTSPFFTIYFFISFFFLLGDKAGIFLFFSLTETIVLILKALCVISSTFFIYKN